MVTIKDVIERNVQVKTDELVANQAKIKLMEFIAARQTDPKIKAQYLVARDATKASIPKLEEELQSVKDFLETLE